MGKIMIPPSNPFSSLSVSRANSMTGSRYRPIPCTTLMLFSNDILLRYYAGLACNRPLYIMWNLILMLLYICVTLQAEACFPDLFWIYFGFYLHPHFLIRTNISSFSLLKQVRLRCRNDFRVQSCNEGLNGCTVQTVGWRRICKIRNITMFLTQWGGKMIFSMWEYVQSHSELKKGGCSLPVMQDGNEFASLSCSQAILE